MKKEEALLGIAKILYKQAAELDPNEDSGLTDFNDSKEAWMLYAEEILDYCCNVLKMLPPRAYLKNLKAEDHYWEK